MPDSFFGNKVELGDAAAEVAFKVVKLAQQGQLATSPQRPQLQHAVEALRAKIQPSVAINLDDEQAVLEQTADLLYNPPPPPPPPPPGGSMPSTSAALVPFGGASSSKPTELTLEDRRAKHQQDEAKKEVNQWKSRANNVKALIGDKDGISPKNAAELFKKFPSDEVAILQVFLVDGTAKPADVPQDKWDHYQRHRAEWQQALALKQGFTTELNKRIANRKSGIEQDPVFVPAEFDPDKKLTVTIPENSDNRAAMLGEMAAKLKARQPIDPANYVSPTKAQNRAASSSKQPALQNTLKRRAPKPANEQDTKKFFEGYIQQYFITLKDQLEASFKAENDAYRKDNVADRIKTFEESQAASEAIDEVEFEKLNDRKRALEKLTTERALAIRYLREPSHAAVKHFYERHLGKANVVAHQMTKNHLMDKLEMQEDVVDRLLLTIDK